MKRPAHPGRTMVYREPDLSPADDEWSTHPPMTTGGHIGQP
jgi:hypothetical protein